MLIDAYACRERQYLLTTALGIRPCVLCCLPMMAAIVLDAWTAEINLVLLPHPHVPADTVVPT